MGGRPLSGATGAVLDPIFALRRRVRIAPGATAHVDFWTMVASSRADVLDLIDKHHDVGAFERAAALAWTQAQVQLHHLGIDRSEAGQYQRLAGHIVYAAPMLRPPSETIKDGSGGQPGLWPLGISGDLPIILVRISDVDQLDVAREALQAVEYWRMKRLAVDLVILNERASSYVQDLQSALETLVRASQSRPQIGDERPPGHNFMLRADLILPEARALLESVARVVLLGARGRLADQFERAPEARPSPRPMAKRAAPASELQVSRPAPGVEYFNGLGGFAEGGREYVTILGPGQSTPAPWINVVANPGFGFQVSAEGGGYAWSVNSREHQLTPWSNDPVTDRPGQAFYLRRRRDRGSLEPHCAADPRRSGDLCGAAWMGLQPFRTRFAGNRRRAARVCAARRSAENLAVETAQPFRPRQTPVGDGVRRMGSRRLPGGGGADRDHAHRCRHRGDACKQPVESDIRRSSRLCRSRRTPDELDRRSPRVHWPQRDAGLAGGPGQRRHALGAGRLRTRSLRRSPDHGRDRAERRRRDRLLPRRRAG